MSVLGGVFRIERNIALLEIVVGEVLECDLDRVQHQHQARHSTLEVSADAGIQAVCHCVCACLRDAKVEHELLERSGRNTAPPQCHEREETRVVPVADHGRDLAASTSCRLDSRLSLALLLKLDCVHVICKLVCRRCSSDCSSLDKHRNPALGENRALNVQTTVLSLHGALLFRLRNLVVQCLQ